MSGDTYILLVEDDARIMAMNRAHLEGQGYRVLCAGTLAEARELLGKTPVDLIILDVMLPDGNGYAFCEELRAHTDIPLLFLTCLGDSGNIVEGLSRGGDDYIVKPYHMDVLSSRVVAALRRSARLHAGRIEIPPLSINLANDEVRLHGKNLQLSRKEIQLLAFFASRQGKEFSSKEIYEAVWNMPAADMTHTVTVHISSLRKKLGADFEKTFAIVYTAEKKYVFFRLQFAPEP